MPTKKDFEQAAQNFRTVKTVSLLYGGPQEWHDGFIYAFNNLIYEFANSFAESNPRFNREKFNEACGLISRKSP